MKSPKKVLRKYLKKITDFLDQKEERPSVINSPINTLAPRILTDLKEIERIKPYLKSIKQAIDEPEVNNIAITGSYGSGKSTILKTFQHLNRDYGYLNISLASFKDNKEKQEGRKFQRKLEISILQQMFYHVKPSEIPDSRFKRIVNLTTVELLLSSSFLILWLFSALVLFKFDRIEKLNPESWRYSYNIDWVTLLVSSLFFIGIGLFAKRIYRLFKNSKINKLTIKGELELGESIDKSVFNQHLEEILYFFERTEFNVVVIEDVDRFDSTDIFTKLREINILINNSKLIKRSVKFVYAIKDEIFKDKNERVKFFDFIIPVIPFINPSNAGEQLTKLIADAKLENVLSKDFTQDIIAFIDDIDMRLLINIFQEYCLYREHLSKDIEQDKQDNLFAMILYKNLYPDDFGELPKRKGKLYPILASKKSYAINLVSQINNRIKEIESEIVIIEKEIEKPLKELRAVYINKIVSKIDGFHTFYFNARITIDEALTDASFLNIKNSEDIRFSGYQVYQYQYQFRLSDNLSSGLKFSHIEKEVNKELSYDQREKLLSDKKDNRVNSLKIEIEALKEEIAEIESLSLKEIFEHVDVDQHLGEFKDNLLIRTLLLNGYINENYHDYISIFHEVTLTREDSNFERKVRSSSFGDFNYPLKDTQELLKRIDDNFFKREAILNFALLDALLASSDRYSNKLKIFFTLLAKDNENSFRFILGYIERESTDLNTFINTLLKHKRSLWFYLKNKSGLPEERVRQFVKIMFEYGNDVDISSLTERETLVEFLAEIEDFFQFTSSFKNHKNIQHFITDHAVYIKKLDVPAIYSESLFEYVYKYRCYQLNEHNVSIVVNMYTKNLSDALKTAHYTTLKKSQLTPLLDYISENLEHYVSNVVLQISGNTEEEEDVVVDILNNEQVSIDTKGSLVKSQKVKISSLDKVIDDDIKLIVFSNNRVEPIWENLFRYFDLTGGGTFDENLISFLNEKENYLTLSQEKIDSSEQRGEDFVTHFSEVLVNCDELQTKAFEQLLESVIYTFDEFNYEQLSREKIDVLIRNSILNLSVENYTALKSLKRDQHIRLVEIHIDDFTNDSGPFNVEANDWVLVLKSSEIKMKNKLTLIEKIDEAVIVNNPSLALAICDILPTDRIVPLSFETLQAIFKAYQALTKRIDLLNLYFDTLDDNQIQSLMGLLGDDYEKIFLKQHKPIFANISQNRMLFKKLQERELIIRFEEIDKKENLRVIAKY